MREYFPEPKSWERRAKVELDVYNYAFKSNFENATGVDTSDFARNTDLANFKFDVDKLNIDKLKYVANNLSNLKNKVYKLDAHKLVLVSVDLSKLSGAVKY